MVLVVVAKSREQSWTLLDILAEQGYTDGRTASMQRLKDWSKDRTPVAWKVDSLRKSDVEGTWMSREGEHPAYPEVTRVSFWEYVGPVLRGYNDD